MEGRKLLKEFWWLIALLAALFAFGGFVAVFNQPASTGKVSSCLVQATGPAQGYGPTDQSITCESPDFGVISITTPKNKIYSVGQNGSTSEKPLGTEIALVASDVNVVHASALEHGAVELKAPEQKPWGQVVSYVRCPSGVLLELCTPVAG